MIVASFTDAWIETADGCTIKSSPSVASFTDAWIETTLISIKFPALVVASFTDAWIETRHDISDRSSYTSRIFYRCVD